MDFWGPTLDAELGAADADKRKVALLFAVWTLHGSTPPSLCVGTFRFQRQ